MATNLVDTVQQRRSLFQATILHMERKYDLTTRQAVKMLYKEMKEAVYYDTLVK